MIRDPRSIGDVDLAAVGAVLADPARARVLLALTDGRALAATMLAQEAGVSPSTASHHLARLLDAGFVTAVRRGRNRYFALAGPLVAELIEAAARIAPAQPVTSLRQGTRAHAIRYARSCYDHLAGRLGVAVAETFVERGLLSEAPESFVVTEDGAAAFGELGIDARPGETARACLDWTEQRVHVAGSLGRAVMSRLLELDWLSRDPVSRAVRLTDTGRSNIERRLRVELPAA